MILNIFSSVDFISLFLIIIFVIFMAWLLNKGISGSPACSAIEFTITDIVLPCPGSISFSSLNNNKMKQVKLIDTEAMGKSILVTASLKANEAGNIPKTVAGSARVSSTDDTVAAGEVGEVDIDGGKYPTKVNLSGKAGSAIVTFTVSPDVDGSGDPEISYSFLVEVGTAEATGFDEENIEVSELQ